MKVLLDNKVNMMWVEFSHHHCKGLHVLASIGEYFNNHFIEI